MAGQAYNQIWLTSALKDEDVPGALTLCFSLKRLLTTRKVGVIASRHLSIKNMEALHHGFDLFFHLEEYRNTAQLKEIDFVKLYALSLKPFEKCVYLAPTMLAIKNFDEIFVDYDGREGSIVWLEKDDNFSFLMIRPSLKAFEALMNCLQFNDQALEPYLRAWTENQGQTKDPKFLPENYHRLLSSQNEGCLGNEVKVSVVNVVEIPFEANPKKFGFFAQMVLEKRKQIFEGLVHPLLSKSKFSSGIDDKADSEIPFKHEPIAIVGMSCRYPAANNVEEFWNLLSNGGDGTGNPPDFRWQRANRLFKTVRDCRNTNAGFLKTSVEDFDAKFFGISPKEMIFLDPQHRLLHELVWEGLEDAALNPQSLEGTEGGVFIGSWTNEYKDIMSQAGHDEFYRIYMGNSIGAAAARISHLLGLTGPSLATESGCSSAMVAVHLACKSLQRGESSFALACGVNLILTPFDKDIMPMVLSPDGHCKTFDANANGFARAEGCGVLVLKRLSDAVKDGDNIWALIRGTGMTQEGVSKSMGTPTVHCESMAMKLALFDGGVLPEQVSYVETHGTGTAVGDPLEVAAIAKAYYSKERKSPLLIGSVKTNIGHTESCSGIAGIMKVVLAMQNETIPAHRNFETLNPAINLDAVPAAIPLSPVPWPKELGKPRVAGVSSFGITGTDAHAIIEESLLLHTTKLISNMTQDRSLHIMKITAKTDDALDVLLENYGNHIDTTQIHFKHLAYTANIGRADFGQRAIIIASSNEEAVSKIQKNKYFRGESTKENIGNICFLFTGQGSQYPGMAKELYQTCPVFRIHFEYCEKILKTKHNIDISQVIWGNNSNEVSRTIYSQTSIFCVEVALLKLWESWGIKPDYVLGHSLGEFAAAVCAGILSVEDALKLVAERSRLIDQLPRGKMLVIKADKQVVDSTMKKFACNNPNKMIEYAAINSNEQTVVAGDLDVVLAFSEFCKQNNLKSILLEATHAFHSSHMDPMLNDYRNVAQTVTNMEGNCCKYISGMKGSIVAPNKIVAEYWVQHTREKVLFLEASKKAVELGCKVFIEIGPQPVLSALTMVNNDESLLCLPSLKRNESEWETLLNTLGKLYMKGVNIDWSGLDTFCNRKKCKLPSYPFTGKTYWPEMVAVSGVTIHPLLGSVISNASATKLFQSSLSLRSLEYVKDHAIGENIIFPGAGYLEICLAAGLATLEGTNDVLSPPTRPVKVENLLIQAPLCFEETTSCQIQTVVELNTTNDNQGDWNDFQVNICRNLENGSGKWLTHAKAKFSPILSSEEIHFSFDSIGFMEILERPSTESLVTEIYNKLDSIGLKFGPTFRSIERMWRHDANTMVAKVKLPQVENGHCQYIVHPVVLDAMIQAIIMLRDLSSLKKKLYLPIKVGKFVWLSKLDTSKEVYIYSSSDHQGSATAVLVDETGTPSAVMSGVELVDSTVKAIESVLEHQTISMPDMYEEVWKPKMGAGQCYADIKKASGKFYTEEFRKSNEELIQNQPAHIFQVFKELETFAYWNMLRGLYECGWEPVQPGEVFEEETLFQTLGIVKQHRQYFGFMLEIFEQEGILKKVETEEMFSPISWQMIRVPTMEEVMQTLTSNFVSNLVAKFKSTLLFGKVGEALCSILKGEQNGLSVLFPTETTNYPSAAEFYLEYAEIFQVEFVMSQVFSKWLETAKEKINDESCIIRVLEIGAGTGSLTGTLLNTFKKHNVPFEYTYTDISAAFFPAAEKKFESHKASMLFKKLNVEEDPINQGFTPEYYDFVFASDVIHATKNIRQSLMHMRMLMKPHGKLDIQEMTRILRVGTYSFGLLDGFWRFEDRELRPKHCTLSKQTWQRVLEDSGFQINGIFSTINDYQSIICSERTEASLCKVVSSVKPNKLKVWLIFHVESLPVSDYIIRKINSVTTRRAITILRNAKYTGESNEYSFTLCGKNEQDFVSMIESLRNRKLEIEGIVYCWALDVDRKSQEEILQPFFNLSKAILNTKQSVLPRFYALTSGVVPLEENDLSHFHSGSLWGFLKALKSENLGLNGRCIEVADGRWDEARLQEIFYEIWNLDKDNMAVFSGNSRLIPKLQPHTPINNSLSLPKGTDRFQLVLPETKSISDLQFAPLESVNLKPKEVEVQIKASALNFRDILSIIKPSDDFKHVNTVGFDFAGVIKKVGEHVTKWKVGDNVFGCNVHFTAMPSYISLHEELLLPLPENLSFCEGATMPAVYTTSVLCLINVAKITKDDVVLIHAASGGVGLSAIEICKHVGCKVIATAGNKRKQNYLKSLGIQHIYNSRNTKYGEQILELTNGRGVDAVLNSLTTDGFKEATLKACAEGARFVEMSKLNIWTKEEVRQLRPDIKYFAVDLSQSSRAEWQELLKDLKPLLDENIIKPVPYVRYDVTNVREALQYLQKAKHIGKVVCALPNFKNENGNISMHIPIFNNKSTYLITGGLGGIGFVVCNWMLENGAKHILLVGRSPPKADILKNLNQLNSKGANVLSFELDIGNFEQCKNLIEIDIVKLGLPPLKGIMHAAGTLADGLIVNHDWESFSSTFKTKVDGTINLHELTKHLSLEHFVLFSSMAAIFGTPGQCNHSAGNSFEDAFAHYRHSIGLPASTINYGQWGEVGIATEVELPGVKTLSSLHGIKGLEYVLKTQRTQTAVINVASFVIMGKFYPHLSTYLDERFWKKGSAGATITMTGNADAFWQQYETASDTKTKVDILKSHLRNILKVILKLEENESIEDEADMQEMGVDSLMFVEIKNYLQTLMGDRLTITTSSLKDCNTINLISTTIVDLIEGALRPQEEIQCKPTFEEVKNLMRIDSCLPDHIRAKEGQQVISLDKCQVVLVTGCTGTLGPYVLRQLTNLPQIQQVICLIRPSTTMTPDERLRKILSKLKLLHEVTLEKVSCVAGNVAEPHLGMEFSIWEELCSKVDVIFHCAAIVNHTEQYTNDEKQNGMRAVNIGGIKNILEFACEKRLKRVYYASSLLAVVTIDNERVSERWPEMGEYDGITTLGYPITKFVGELLSKQAAERGIPIKSFRFPYIVGESETGRCSIERSHVLLRYMFIMKHGIIPSVPLLLIMLPVDICADVSVRLFFDQSDESAVYNISHTSPSADHEFVNVAKRFGHSVKMVEYCEFAEKVRQSEGDDGPALSLFKDFYGDDDMMMSTFSTCPVLRKCVEEESGVDSKSMWWSENVARIIPTFYDNQKPTVEYIYSDLLFCKSQGWFEKFGLDGTSSNDEAN